jgi:glycopeptide antibiotics resistance protein
MPQLLWLPYLAHAQLFTAILAGMTSTIRVDRTLTREPAKNRTREWLATSILVLYLVAVLIATMWPTPLDQGFSSSIDRFLAVMHRNGVPEWFGYSKLEFTANIGMFVPLGFLVALLLPRKLWWFALFICPGLSVGIELTQATFLSARFATVVDVIANSLGALVGIAIAVILRTMVHSRDQQLIARALWARGIPD